MQKFFRHKWAMLLLVFLVIEVSPAFGTYIADWIYPYLELHAPFVWNSLHHLAQLVLPLLCIWIWPDIKFKEWGFRTGNVGIGLKWITGFTVIWSIFYAGITLYNLSTNAQPIAYYDVTNTVEFTGELLFRSLIVGPSEEILFRAFPITLLFLYWPAKTTILKFSISHAGIIAAVFFAYAHIGYHVHPPELYHFDPLQVITALGLGLLYAIVFEQTRSVLYPAVIHSISDVIPAISLYIISVYQ